MSKGIRIYEHTKTGVRLYRDNYNVPVGLLKIKCLKSMKSTLFDVLAVGCEEGAMAVHFRWR